MLSLSLLYAAADRDRLAPAGCSLARKAYPPGLGIPVGPMTVRTERIKLVIIQSSLTSSLCTLYENI